MCYLTRSVILPRFTPTASPQTFPKLAGRAIISGVRAHGAFPFLPFLSQTAVIIAGWAGRIPQWSEEIALEKKKRRWTNYSTAGRSSWEKETEGWQQYEMWLQYKESLLRLMRSLRKSQKNLCICASMGLLTSLDLEDTTLLEVHIFSSYFPQLRRFSSSKNGKGSINGRINLSHPS